jgi:hypothetical protein
MDLQWTQTSDQVIIKDVPLPYEIEGIDIKMTSVTIRVVDSSNNIILQVKRNIFFARVSGTIKFPNGTFNNSLLYFQNFIAIIIYILLHYLLNLICVPDQRIKSEKFVGNYLREC